MYVFQFYEKCNMKKCSKVAVSLGFKIKKWPIFIHINHKNYVTSFKSNEDLILQ